MSHVRRQCALAIELRTRLIADTVTGKLDVREASTKLTLSDNDSNKMEEIVATEDLGVASLQERYGTVVRGEA